MFNKGADTIADTYPFPAKIVVKNSTLTLRERGCYFLWLTYSKMATIRIAKVSSTINSSYVLIEKASFRSRLGNGGIYTLSASRVSIVCFPLLVGIVRHLCRCSFCIRNGALTPNGEWFFHSSSRKSGKIPVPVLLIGSTLLVVSDEFRYTTWILKTANEKRCLFCQPQPFVRG